MKKLKTILLFITCITVTVISLRAISNPQQPNKILKQSKSPSIKYVNPTGNEFPLLGWITFCTEKELTTANFKTLRDAGFNISLGAAMNEDLTLKALSAANGTGVKIMVNCPAMRNPKLIAQTIPLFKNNSNVMGYYVWDEPTVNDIPKWANICKIIQSYDSIHIPLVNLFPYGPPKQNGASSYTDYLQYFIDNANPAMISYDNYAIINQNGKTLVFEEFYNNLEIASNVATLNGIPFWAFCLSSPLGNYPDPTKEYLTFEAFSALAYGAQGLSYFTYTIPPNTKIPFKNAPINQVGEKTHLWNLVRDNNRQIQNLSKVFLGAKLIGVWHTGDKLPKGTKRLSVLPQPFKSILSEKKGILVSYLKNNDSHYIVLVNHDIQNKQNVKITTTSPIIRIKWDSTDKIVSSPSLTLEPGGYAIFTWENK